MVVQVVFVMLLHALPLVRVREILVDLLTHTEGVLELAVSKLRPLRASGGICLWSVRNDWLHFYLLMIFTREE